MVSVAGSVPGKSGHANAHLFDPFFGSKDRRGGTGPGLPSCLALVSSIGGFVAVESDPTAGAVVRVYLPRLAPSDSDCATERGTVLKGGSETVLVAETDPVMRRLTAKMLASHGYRVLTARDGEEALRVSREHDGPIHLLLTDAAVPRMSAPDLLRQMQARHPHLRVIVMAEYADDEYLLRVGERRELPLLQKPFTEMMLAHAIRGELDRRGD